MLFLFLKMYFFALFLIFDDVLFLTVYTSIVCFFLFFEDVLFLVCFLLNCDVQLQADAETARQGLESQLLELQQKLNSSDHTTTNLAAKVKVLRQGVASGG